MEINILKEKQFIAYRGEEQMTAEPFRFDEEVSVGDKTIGYWSNGGCWSINNICEAIETGFSTTKNFTLVAIN